jgi:hypothetical protein
MSSDQEFSTNIKIRLSLALYISTIILFLGFYMVFDHFYLPIKFFIPLNMVFLWDLLVYYSLLVLGSFLAQFIIIQILVRRKKKKLTIRSEHEEYSLWDYFIQKPSIYRYFIFEGFYWFFYIYGLNLLGLIVATTISAFLFGLAHKSNGFFGYVVNSMIGGIFFGLFFFQWGLFGSWMLHFFWNFLVIIDYYYKYKLSQI